MQHSLTIDKSDNSPGAKIGLEIQFGTASNLNWEVDSAAIDTRPLVLR
jgi:hypothetical protein